MKIIIDAMGGDNAPLEIVRGALSAHSRFGCDIVLAGDEAAIRAAAARCGAATLPQGVTLRPTTETVEMCDDPATVFRRKKDTSMGVALTMLRDGEGDAAVSAGSTGALLTGATLITKRIHGIRRAAMAPVIPTTTGSAVLIDCGANAECTPEYLLQFAYLGNFYAQRVLNVARPRVGLLNIGAEDSKGTDLQKQTLALLREADGRGDLHFIGNIEAKDAIKGGCDVIVTDGFSGNVTRFYGGRDFFRKFYLLGDIGKICAGGIHIPERPLIDERDGTLGTAFYRQCFRRFFLLVCVKLAFGKSVI